MNRVCASKPQYAAQIKTYYECAKPLIAKGTQISAEAMEQCIAIQEALGVLPSSIASSSGSGVGGSGSVASPASSVDPVVPVLAHAPPSHIADLGAAVADELPGILADAQIVLHAVPDPFIDVVVGGGARAKEYDIIDYTGHVDIFF